MKFNKLKTGIKLINHLTGVIEFINAVHADATVQIRI